MLRLNEIKQQPDVVLGGDLQNCYKLKFIRAQG